MKRYLLFIGSTYYPNGGMEDFNRDFDDLDTALDFFDRNCKDQVDWAHIYDVKEKRIIMEYDKYTKWTTSE